MFLYKNYKSSAFDAMTFYTACKSTKKDKKKLKINLLVLIATRHNDPIVSFDWPKNSTRKKATRRH